MLKSELLEIIASGENSGVEFKRDDIRPVQMAREIVGMANVQGGMVLLGVENDGTIGGITRPNLEEWVMDTVFERYIHPLMIPHYLEVLVDDHKRVAAISVSVGTAKPYVLRYNDREEIYFRMGSTTRLATREQALRLFGSGGLLHIETLPVSGTSLKHLDRVRLENYLLDILGEPALPASESEWIERLEGLGFLTRDTVKQLVCTVAGLVLFGITPRRYLRQAGLRIIVFDANDKQYRALLDVILDGPMVGRWNFEEGKTLIDEGIIEKFIRTIEPFISVEADKIEEKSFRRLKHWLYPLEAVRETVLNALAHRDWTRSVDIEITRYNDRLEIISPGALPNSMDLEKMKAGRRTPRNPLVLEVLRDYGYVDARGMGMRLKVIPLVKQFTGGEPVFEATDDYLKTLIPVGDAPENNEIHLKNGASPLNAPEKQGKNGFQGRKCPRKYFPKAPSGPYQAEPRDHL
jgi:ATP-dependent DNA helicase RecG